MFIRPSFIQTRPPRGIRIRGNQGCHCLWSRSGCQCWMAQLVQESRKQETYTHHCRACVFLAVVWERSRVSHPLYFGVNDHITKLWHVPILGLTVCGAFDARWNHWCWPLLLDLNKVFTAIGSKSYVLVGVVVLMKIPVTDPTTQLLIVSSTMALVRPLFSSRLCRMVSLTFSTSSSRSVLVSSVIVQADALSSSRPVSVGHCQIRHEQNGKNDKIFWRYGRLLDSSDDLFLYLPANG